MTDKVFLSKAMTEVQYLGSLRTVHGIGGDPDATSQGDAEQQKEATKKLLLKEFERVFEVQLRETKNSREDALYKFHVRRTFEKFVKKSQQFRESSKKRECFKCKKCLR